MVSAKQIEILEKLAKYKFLTIPQMVDLKLYKNKFNLYPVLRDLIQTHKPLIKKQQFTRRSFGKENDIFFLTNNGVSFLVDELEYNISDIKYKKDTASLFTRDYDHRTKTIDFNIMLDNFLNTQKDSETVFFNYYFDKNPNGKENINKIILDKHPKYKSFTPDGAFKIYHNEKEYFYLFEQHNGKSTRRLFEHLEQHLFALSQTEVFKKYDLKKGYRVLIVTELKGIKERIIEFVKSDERFTHFLKFFLFATEEELKRDFFGGWQLYNGEKSTLF